MHQSRPDLRGRGDTVGIEPATEGPLAPAEWRETGTKGPGLPTRTPRTTRRPEKEVPVHLPCPAIHGVQDLTSPHPRKPLTPVPLSLRVALLPLFGSHPRGEEDTTVGVGSGRLALE